MNLLLIHRHELADNQYIVLRDRRAQHLLETLRVQPGDQIRTGIIDGFLGTAQLRQIEADGSLHLQVTDALQQPPPAPLPCQLILAMPRPKMLRRVLQNAAAMGVKDIHLIHCWKVEKSYWQTPWLAPESLEENLLLGLEQAGDTGLPKVGIHRLFKPFVEDILPGLIAGRRALLAHPRTSLRCPVALTAASSLIIGPEGGFTDYEVGKLQEAGAEAVHIGERILRVETAVPALLSRLYPA